MNPALPARLKAAADALLEGVSRKDLAMGSTAISRDYRAGKSSAGVIASDADALAYLVTRLPATYAVAAAVLDQVRAATPDFAPATLLDAGAGPGTAAWAAREAWPGLAEVTLTDSNAAFRDLARKLVPEAQILARDLIRDPLPAADLVIASFVIAEIAEPASIIAKLYAAAGDILVLIEPGTPAGFERLRTARAQLIGQGANILGPCTHANACPMTGADWCHFSQRLPRSRDHMRAKGGTVPYEDERYAWLAVSRARLSANAGAARVLAPPQDSKPGIALKLCTPSGLETRFIARRDKPQFAAMRKMDWGDIV